MKSSLSTIAAIAATVGSLHGAVAELNTEDGTISLDGYTSRNVTVLPGFKLELLYVVPRTTQGSWVSMTPDPKGRLIVCDQNGGLYRVTVPSIGSSGAVQTEPINLDIGGAHGLLYAFDSLYVNVDEGSKAHGVYRVRDTDGDDRFDQVRVLRNLRGSGEHGVHALVLSPDGKSIYMVNGNASSLTDINSSRVPMIWGEDNLTRIPTGFMDNSYAPQGYIARMDPDGKTWELFATGFRNPYDVAFNRDGELFTYDADMEWDMGDPWYRPTRVNHVISGAEFGFRNGSGKWPEHCLDSFGTVADIGAGSPTGVTFGYGAKFPAKYQDAFYINDWTYGILWAVHLTPSGASYTGVPEKFVTGQPMALTDIVINPADGAMYFAVGGRNGQSALYRVTYVGKESTAPSQPDTRFQAQRNLRRKLEAFHGHQDAKAIATAWPYLGDQDRAIRYAARVAVEWQDATQWREKALAETDVRKSIAALVALARVSGRDEIHRQPAGPAPDPALRARMLASLGRIDYRAIGHHDKLDLLRAYALVFTRLGRPDEETLKPLIAKFDPLFPAATREENFELAELLVYLQSPNAASKLMAALRSAPSKPYQPRVELPMPQPQRTPLVTLAKQEEQIHYALHLRALRTGWTLPLREEFFRWFVQAASEYNGGNTFLGSLNTMRTDALAALNEAERTALQPVLDLQPTRQPGQRGGRRGGPPPGQ